MKKLLITAIAINFAAMRSNFDHVFEAYLHGGNHCDQLSPYSDEKLQAIRFEAWNKSFNASDSEEIRNSINFMNFISKCRFPMNIIYNPENFINKENETLSDRVDFLRSFGLAKDGRK